MVGHQAVLDYSNYSASLHRHGKQYSLIPRYVPTDKGRVPTEPSEPIVEQPTSGPLPRMKKAAKRAGSSDQHSKYTDCFGGLDRKLVVLRLGSLLSRVAAPSWCWSLRLKLTRLPTLAAVNVTAPASSSSADNASLDPE